MANVPDVHVYEIDYVDADGKPRKKRAQLVRGGRTPEEALDFMRQNAAMFNDERGRKPRSVNVGSLRKLEPATAEAAVRARLANLPPGLEQNIRVNSGLAPANATPPAPANG